MTTGIKKIMGLVVCILVSSVFFTVRAQPPGPVPAEVRLQPGQTLEDLAEKYFDDPTAADEIRALNNIPAGTQPKPDTTLRLPGKERDQALMTLRVATQALQQAKADGAEEFAPHKLQKTQKSLQAAKEARKRAAYQDCRRLADETWALAGKDTSDKPTLLRVDLSTGQTSTVTTFPFGGVRGVTLSPDEQFAYVTGCDEVQRVDLTTGDVTYIGEDTYGWGLNGCILTADGSTLYVAQRDLHRLFKVDVTSGEVLTVASGLHLPVGVALAPGETTAWENVR